MAINESCNAMYPTALKKKVTWKMQLEKDLDYQQGYTSR